MPQTGRVDAVPESRRRRGRLSDAADRSRRRRSRVASPFPGRVAAAASSGPSQVKTAQTALFWLLSCGFIAEAAAVAGNYVEAATQGVT